MSWSHAEAQSFAKEWLRAWNGHDIDAILKHYSEEIVFHSPGIARVTGQDTYSVSGKSELRKYWEAALARLPDLRFDSVISQ